MTVTFWDTHHLYPDIWIAKIQGAVEMKKCPKCGQTYDDSWKICLHCSVNLSDDLSTRESNPELRNKAENKRPNGVTILGTLIIIGAVLSLLSIREGWQFNRPISNYLYLIIVPFSIVVGVFLLKLKNWAFEYGLLHD